MILFCETLKIIEKFSKHSRRLQLFVMMIRFFATMYLQCLRKYNRSFSGSRSLSSLLTAAFFLLCFDSVRFIAAQD